MTYKFNSIEIEYFITNDNVNCQIKDSYKINSKSYMKAFLKYLKVVYPQFNKRSDASYIREWTAHNFLYKLNFCTARTKDTDLNINEYWYRRLAYYFISFFVKLDK